MRYEEVVDAVNQIIPQYTFRLTVRQIYYRLVSPPFQLFPNKRSKYQYFDRILTRARERGAVDWRQIEDRARQTLGGDYGWSDPDEYLEHKISELGECRYTKLMWEKQPLYVEVWVEKDALASLFENAARGFRVVVYPSRGYSSFTKIMEALEERFVDRVRNGQQPIILHFTDHDPSGIDMTADIINRFNEYFPTVLRQNFSNEELDELVETYKAKGVKHIYKVERKALIYGQVQQFQLAPNPTKSADPRSEEYVAKYGNECWELDALPPDELTKIIRRSIWTNIDDKIWNDTIKKAKEEKAELEKQLKELAEIVKKRLEDKNS